MEKKTTKRMRDGRMNVKSYYDGGELESIKRYRGGVLHGRQEWYFRSGTRSDTALFEDGQPVGYRRR